MLIILILHTNGYILYPMISSRTLVVDSIREFFNIIYHGGSNNTDICPRAYAVRCNQYTADVVCGLGGFGTCFESLDGAGRCCRCAAETKWHVKSKCLKTPRIDNSLTYASLILFILIVSLIVFYLRGSVMQYYDYNFVMFRNV